MFVGGSIAAAWEVTVHSATSSLLNAEVTHQASDFELVRGEHDVADHSVRLAVAVWL